MTEEISRLNANEFKKADGEKATSETWWSEEKQKLVFDSAAAFMQSSEDFYARLLRDWFEQAINATGFRRRM